MLMVVQSAPAQAFQVIHTFTFTDGAEGLTPDGVIMDAAGNLYGTAQEGGQMHCDYDYLGCGTVFKLSNNGSGWIFATLYRFRGYPQRDGRDLNGGVILGRDGSLYGTTFWGGLSGDGLPGYEMVYKITPPAGTPSSTLEPWTETVLYRFNEGAFAIDGVSPASGVAFDAAGNVYGTTTGSLPGANGSGTVFELSPWNGRWIEKILAFAGGSGVTFDKNGNLFGMTTGWYGSGGCGTVFELTPSTDGNWTFSVLYSLTRNPSMTTPYGLVMDG